MENLSPGNIEAPIQSHTLLSEQWGPYFLSETLGSEKGDMKLGTPGRVAVPFVSQGVCAA